MIGRSLSPERPWKIVSTIVYWKHNTQHCSYFTSQLKPCEHIEKFLAKECSHSLSGSGTVLYAKCDDLLFVQGISIRRLKVKKSTSCVFKVRNAMSNTYKINSAVQKKDKTLLQMADQ